MDEVRPEPRLSGRAYHIVTYGCQMNAHDSEQIAGILDRMGMHEAASRDEADLVIYNTCCVRDNAERRALGNVGWLKELKKVKPELMTGVCGCMVQQPGMAEKLIKRYPFLDIAFGTHELYKLPDMMRELLDSRARVVCVSEDDMVAEGLPVKRVSRIQAYVNIMYGCNNFCSYCIVPYVRGRERSRLPEDILREVEELKCDGVREVMLLGQNVNSYSGGGLDFAGLLREVDAIGIERIRFMTSHPKDLSDALIDVMANSRHICHQLHLPVQHGSDRVLEAMNRRYTAAHYLGLVDKLRGAMPDIGLTTDLIVGFPGETEDDFKATLDLVERVRYDSAYTFIFSPRQGTVAASMPNQVDEETSRRRIHELIAVQERITGEIYAGQAGRIERVLVEGPAARGEGKLAGRTERGITVNFTGTASEGELVDVKILGAGHNTLKGEQVGS
ncbi:MAG TPA: tRNA (N6-isopentenyl adenosine(37)-C2)-methylthiotransferase MiaB [Candidatus Fimadaptatus faecigallinarum]|uniref:tRNA-2-methylthio-N(6)-dimethylallyladenosine synthase n=1 Tax=Candidatus Fimadaptatus faecigallinarum TaxID=2840814 RepID=A0A9D1S4P5_9FIRM|nr:tRNA (N6-isopentenyl adenosine(37)-C2)-methylthiotransferase MiaB [Candidatus Fimadaptatus faecigallinarum]